MSFANDVLGRLGLAPVSESIVATVEIPVEQDWRGDVDIDIDSIEDSLRENIWADQSAPGLSQRDLEIDTSYGDVSVEVNVTVNSIWRGDVKLEREDPSERLEDLVAEQVELPGDWQVAPSGLVKVLRSVRKFA